MKHKNESLATEFSYRSKYAQYFVHLLQLNLPETEDASPEATFELPPLIEEYFPLATFKSPPLTDDCLPEARLFRPPRIIAESSKVSFRFCKRLHMIYRKIADI